MKVAILGDYPQDLSTISGGVEAYIANLVRGLRQFTKLDLHVVARRRGLASPVTAEHPGVTAHYLPADDRLGNVTFFYRSKQLLRRTLMALQPDLIHANIAGVYSAAAFSMNRPAVLTLHGIRAREAKLKRGLVNQWVRFPLRSWEERNGVRTARHIISISPYITEEFGRFIRGHVYPIELPVNDEFFSVRDEARPGRILFVGHVTPRKGPHDLIRAMTLVRQQCPQAELHLAGGILTLDQAYTHSLYEFVHAQGLKSQVRFLGHLTQEALLKEYAECALLVLPSYQETAPYAIEQAMAVGKAVVATAVGGIPYLVAHDRTGLLVERGDVTGLAQAIGRILSDANLRARLAEQARQEAERRFRTDTVARQIYDVYQHILQQEGLPLRSAQLAAGR